MPQPRSGKLRQLGEWGIAFGNPQINVDALRAKKDGIVSQLTGGLSAIARRRKVRVLCGHARFTSEQALDISGETWRFDQAVVAVGSSAIELSGWPEDEE